jgi:hypothetical protein
MSDMSDECVLFFIDCLVAILEYFYLNSSETSFLNQNNEMYIV